MSDSNPTVAETLTTSLSPKGRTALAWIRDHDHHIGRWLVKGRNPICEPPEAWTHFELRGPAGNLRMSVEVWKEIAPFHKVGEDSRVRMFTVTPAGLALLEQSQRARSS